MARRNTVETDFQTVADEATQRYSPVAERRPTIVETSLLGEHSEREPPDPIPNSEVKPLSADDSVAGCHVKVGHRQALRTQPRLINSLGFFCQKGGNRPGFGFT